MSIFKIILGLLAISSMARADRRYKVTEFGDNFQITTPLGRRIFIGDPGISNKRNYKFSIPLSEFKQTFPGALPNLGGNKKFGPEYIESEDELILLANKSYGEGKFTKSQSFIEEILRRNPKNVRAWIMKGSLAHLQGQQKLSKLYWKKALKLDPSNTQIKGLIGE